MEFNTKRLQELFQEEKTITDVAKRYSKEEGIEYTDSIRRKVSTKLSKLDKKVDDDLENDTETDTNQYETALQLSALKEDGTIMSVEEYCEHYKIPYSQVKTYKLVTHTGKGAYYNIASHALKGEGLEKFHKKLLEELSELPNLPTTIFREQIIPSDNGHLLVVDPADIHIGKLADSFETGEDYNSQIAVQRVKEGVKGLLEKAKGFNINKILFVGGNDILHIDTPKRTTTAGTFQDTDGMWYRNFLMAKHLYVDLIQELLQVADVHFVFNPSNHDYVHGFFLADIIQTYFKDVDNITFDCSIAHRKYFVYGQNLIGTTHGDGGKIADLPLTMANESPNWSNCKHKYIYTHHVHHKVSKDYQVVTVESLRSPSPPDSWHHRNQYANIKAIEGFLHHPDFGQVARLTHIL
jgi:hypothetical protein